MLITQLKDKETINSLVAGKKVFIINCHGCKEVHFPEKEGFQSVCVMNQEMTRQELKKKVQQLFAEASYGNVFRVKGFLELPDGNWMELNATRHEMTFTTCTEGQKVVIVIGEKLNQPMIEEVLGGTAI